jgi:hypothetical protein
MDPQFEREHQVGESAVVGLPRVRATMFLRPAAAGSEFRRPGVE